MSSWRLARYIFAHKWMVLGAVSLTIASNLLALLGPALSGYAIDAIGTEAGMAKFNQVYFYCFLMLVFYVVSSALTYVLSILMTKLSQRISYQMRKDLVDKLLELPVRFFDGHRPATSSAAFPTTSTPSPLRCPTTFCRLRPAPSPFLVPSL